MTARRAAHIRRQASVDYPRYPPQNSQTQQPPVMLHAVPVSDYESDNPGYVSDYPLQPPPPTRTIDELNLSVLKTHNSDIAAILSIAPYAVIYRFSPIPEPAWSKTGVEGTMFICQLTPGNYNEDRYHVIVLNRRGLHNFETELREADDGGVEITDPYVIISCREEDEQKIYGVFIFSEGSGTSTEQVRSANADLMKSLALSASSSRKAAEAIAMAAAEERRVTEAHESQLATNNGQTSSRSMDLLKLFGQQQDERTSTSDRNPQLDSRPEQFNPYPTQHQGGVYPGQNFGQAQQQDVLGDLFRRAGLK